MRKVKVRQMHSQKNLLKLLVSVVGVVGVSILFSSPTGAQQSGGATNPRPSIFDEPPYNRSRTGTTPTTPTTPAPTTPPQAPPTTPPQTPPAGATEPSKENIVSLAASNDSFKTLTAALKAAGLTETL